MTTLDMLRERDAEIERLKLELAKFVAMWPMTWKDTEIIRLKGLVTELADWIEAEFEIETFGDGPGKALIKRAREATR